MYKNILQAINELINVALKLDGNDELRRIALSDERLAKDRFAPRLTAKFQKGEDTSPDGQPRQKAGFLFAEKLRIQFHQT